MVDSKPESIAPDLSIEELNLVENFFRTRLDSEQGDQGYHLRNYILWRLILAFGLRIGEALSLRVQDFNLTGADPCCNIVRVDERGQKYTDPRSPYSPLVKTCSRLLYFDCLDFDLIDLIECYVSRFRIARKGSNTIIFLDHDFLFVSHGAAPGRAMSSAAASKIARAVSQKCLPKFHWHLVRHAVFNRLYRAADMLEHNATEIDHIVYMGGWRNPASLRHYVKRAIRDKSRERLIARNNEVLLR
jgi:integrase